MKDRIKGKITSAKEIKNRNTILFIGGVTVSLIILGIFIYRAQQQATKKTQKPPAFVIKEKKKDDTYKEEWRASAKRELEELRKETAELKKELERLRKEREKQSLPLPAGTPSGPKVSSDRQGAKFKVPPPPPLPPAQTSGTPAGFRDRSILKRSQGVPKPQKPKVELMTGLIVVDKETKRPGPEVEKDSKKETPKKKPEGNLIPTGSFVRAVILSGLDAPVGGKAQGEPHPVLMRIVDKTVLPNFWKADIRDCFVIGSGYGDLAAERAYIRLETLSCVKNNGEIVEEKIRGYVSGEDGKVGLIGRVVTKQGQLLGRALLAGFVEGVARAFNYSQMSVTITPAGSLQTVEPDQALQFGAASGFAEAARRLSDFYMKMVDMVMPVIEINAGRVVDLVFLSSVRIGDGSSFVKGGKE